MIVETKKDRWILVSGLRANIRTILSIQTCRKDEHGKTLLSQQEHACNENDWYMIMTASWITFLPKVYYQATGHIKGSTLVGNEEPQNHKTRCLPSVCRQFLQRQILLFKHLYYCPVFNHSMDVPNRP